MQQEKKKKRPEYWKILQCMAISASTFPFKRQIILRFGDSWHIVWHGALTEQLLCTEPLASPASSHLGSRTGGIWRRLRGAKVENKEKWAKLKITQHHSCKEEKSSGQFNNHLCLWVKKKNQGFRGKITSTLSTKSNMLYVFSALPLGSIAVLPGKNDASPTGFILFSEKHVQCVITVTSDYKNEKCAWKWKPKRRMEKKGMVGWINLFYVLQSSITFLGQ